MQETWIDASTLATSAVVYLKVSNGVGEPRISLVCAKTKVAPLKRLTISRLELTAAVLLAKLVKYVKDQLNLSVWKEFVRNHVQLIQEITNVQWKLVPGKGNPAECASRGLTTAQLSSHKLWWQCPSWLKKSSSSWPSLHVSPVVLDDLEEKPGIMFNVKVQSPEIWDLVHRYSSLIKLLRVTAICQRFIAPLNPGGIEQARLFWIKASQSAYFSTELTTLSRAQKLGASHPLTRLTVFLDHQGVLRVGGRLDFAQLDSENKHPVIVPKESRFAQLIIKDAHLRTLHGGTQLTLGQLRQSYWIFGGRAPVRSFILSCVACARQRGIGAQQLIGQLPIARLTPGHAFLNTGVDYAGPVWLRSWKRPGHKSYKEWLAIFVYMATSAVHLEVVSDYTSDGFMSAHRRFVARRGICKNLFSDCGTTFLEADKELKKLFPMAFKESGRMAHLLLSDGTRWSFNPSGAPHFGGEWEAAVKSVKFHLKRTIGDTLLTFEELTTLLAQIEAVLNSRPLEPLSENPDDISALTPGNFLIGQALTALSEPSLDDLNIARLFRWQLVQQNVQRFWKWWSTSYRQHLQSKLHHHRRSSRPTFAHLYNWSHLQLHSRPDLGEDLRPWSSNLAAEWRRVC
ncbi:uncharacterized protein LOC107042769 [Diachasma alloeum]|uniref:uncharacterized protein LOC107042769 n=1 Tax=Diachasma alloeum TaxID=454923 RepID=UPI0007382CFB|nr:uncharacterized protein LOC107042769 [Diachasma alloeum]